MKACPAYRMVPLDSDVTPQHSHNAEAHDQHTYDYVYIYNLQPHPTNRSYPLKSNGATQNPETQDEHPYDYVSTLNFQPHPTARPLPTHDGNDEISYEQIPSNPCYITSHAPKPPPLPPKPSTIGETHSAVYSSDATSTAAYYNLPPYGTQTRPAPKVNPSPRRKLSAATAQEREDHGTFPTLYHTASDLHSSQIEQLIGMLQNIQCS